jgi:GNAT superfamily N-acetyltransferase
MAQAQIGGYRYSDQLAEMDFALIHGFITGSYWAEGISRTRLARAMENSLNFGVFGEDGVQVAYARVVTDRATFAYLCDVFVVESARGRGISKRLMRFILAHPDLQGIRRFNLATRDAHGLYAQFGWTELEDPGRYMEINKPGLYKTLRDEEPDA